MQKNNLVGLGVIGLAAYLLLKKPPVETKSNPVGDDEEEVEIKINPASLPKRIKHKIPQKDLWTVLAFLSYMKENGHMIENVPDKVQDHLLREKWFDFDNGRLTDLGEEVLNSATFEKEEE